MLEVHLDPGQGVHGRLWLKKRHRTFGPSEAIWSIPKVAEPRDFLSLAQPIGEPSPVEDHGFRIMQLDIGLFHRNRTVTGPQRQSWPNVRLPWHECRGIVVTGYCPKDVEPLAPELEPEPRDWTDGSNSPQNALGRPRPIDTQTVALGFGRPGGVVFVLFCRPRRTALSELGDDFAQQCQARTIEGTRQLPGIALPDLDPALTQHVPLVVGGGQAMCRDASLTLASVDDRVEGIRPAILGQERRMYPDGALGWNFDPAAEDPPCEKPADDQIHWMDREPVLDLRLPRRTIQKQIEQPPAVEARRKAVPTRCLDRAERCPFDAMPIAVEQQCSQG